MANPPRHHEGPLNMEFGFGYGGWYGGQDEKPADRNVKPGGYLHPDQVRDRDRGPHAGKGPAGFQRSDARLRERICEALEDHDYIDATNVNVAVHDSDVTLTGSVEDRAQRRLVEDCVYQVSGVRDIHNNLRITTR